MDEPTTLNDAPLDCYTERAHLLALLAAHLNARTYEDEEGEEGFRNVVAIRINGRWLCWHIADKDMYLFRPNCPHWEQGSTLYDGHSTEEKYEHIRQYILP